MVYKYIVILMAISIQITPAFTFANSSSAVYTKNHRIKHIQYDPDNVVELDTVVGITTHIQLHNDEKYITHAFGDSKSYAIDVVNNNVFIKPTAEEANTNLIIVTTKRKYNIKLTLREDRYNATYSLSFHIPDAEDLEQLQVERKKAIEKSFAMQKYSANLDYTMSGDTTIAPINVWDNGSTTYFKFAAHAELPSIYLVRSENNEVLANRTTTGESSQIISINTVGQKWILRLENDALAVFNDKSSKNDSNSSQISRTISPNVIRTKKGL